MSISAEPPNPTSKRVHTVRFGLGGNLLSNVVGFEQIVRLHRMLEPVEDCHIVIDFTGLSGMDAHLAAALKTIFLHAYGRRNTVRLMNMPDRLRETLRKNGLLKDRRHDTYGTTMPVTDFRGEEGQRFSVYAKRYLDRREMPPMTEPLRERFFEGIDELFANSALHSRTPVPIVAAGQFYPRLGRLSFSISDGGRGIQGVYQDVFSRPIQADHAIRWAMASGNTTRQGDIPGGLGSHVLREFVRLNGGRLVIVSNSGFWSQQGSTVRHSALTDSFPGTVVVLDVDTGDQNSYDPTVAPNPNAIW